MEKMEYLISGLHSSGDQNTHSKSLEPIKKLHVHVHVLFLSNVFLSIVSCHHESERANNYNIYVQECNLMCSVVACIGSPVLLISVFGFKRIITKS